MGEGVVGWVAKHQRPAIINNLKKDKRYVLLVPGGGLPLKKDHPVLKGSLGRDS